MKPEKIISGAIAFAVGKYGAFLATRDAGRSARHDLETAITTAAGEHTVIIVFDAVDAMTISFADEFLGRFYSDLASGDINVRGTLLRGLNDDTREAVAVCLERRDLAGVEITQGGGILIGGADFLIDTYTEALKLGTFRAAELSEALEITPQNANNRLKRLVAAGAVHRRRALTSERGGKEFVYVALPESQARQKRDT
jgi:DNA-binding transcriptional ArsR family regulator